MKVFKSFVAAAIVAAFAVSGHAEDKVVSPLSVKMKSIDGKDLDLSKYKGKVVLIVNVASKCGLTPHYEGLQALYAAHEKDGLVVLGVPANDFGKQEPGTEEEIQKFCSAKYNVTFPMTSKVVVTGKEKTELYKILTDATPEKGKVKEISWNFEKFVIGRDGKVVARFEPKTKPDDAKFVKTIKDELEKK
jgi:glutathione peroxidase